MKRDSELLTLQALPLFVSLVSRLERQNVRTLKY